MVRSGMIDTCFFCDEFHSCNRLVPGGFLAQVFGAALGVQKEDAGSDSEDDVAEPVRQMVQKIGVDEGRAHVTSALHLARMSGVLRNRKECDRVLRQVRPTDAEHTALCQCMDELKRALRAQELHWCGSVGKATALRGAHDLDVCVKLGNGFVGTAAVNEIARRLLGTAFSVVRKERTLVFARYGQFELDLIAELPEDNRWEVQVAHLGMLRHMNAACKDAVRLLKAWSRLVVPVPGILLEILVMNLAGSMESHTTSQVQSLFISAVEALRTRKPLLDPVTAKDISEALDGNQWTMLSKYAKETLELQHMEVAINDSPIFSTFPIRFCGSKILIGPNGKRSAVLPMDGFEVVELCTRLATRIPDSELLRDYLPRPKNLNRIAKKNCERFDSFAQQFIMPDIIKRQFKEKCEELKILRVQSKLPESDLRVQSTLAELQTLLDAMHSQPGGGCRNVQLEWLFLVKLFTETMQEISKTSCASSSGSGGPSTHVAPAPDMVPVGLFFAVVVLILAFFIQSR